MHTRNFSRRLILAGSLILPAIAAADAPSPPSTAPSTARARATVTTRPLNDASKLEQLLCGQWNFGGACIGDIEIRADKTYTWKGYSPGNNTMVGTWEVRWDALPPKLKLYCKTSDEPDYAGHLTEARITRLSGDELQFQYTAGSSFRFLRGTAEEAEKRLMDTLEGTWKLIGLRNKEGDWSAESELTKLSPVVIQGKTWSNPQKPTDAGLASSVSVFENCVGGTLSFDPGNSAETVNFVCTTGPSAGRTLAGKFIREDDTLWVFTRSITQPTDAQHQVEVPEGERPVLHQFKKVK